MYHRVTQHLTIEASSSGVAIEFSRAVTLGDDNAVTLDGGLTSQSGTSDRVRYILQGSNDGSKWTDIDTLQFGSGSPASVSTPYLGRLELADSLPWSLVRVKYIVESSASCRIQLWAGIETFRRG